MRPKDFEDVHSTDAVICQGGFLRENTSFRLISNLFHAPSIGLQLRDPAKNLPEEI